MRSFPTTEFLTISMVKENKVKPTKYHAFTGARFSDMWINFQFTDENLFEMLAVLKILQFRISSSTIS